MKPRIVGAALLAALFVCTAGAADKKLKVALTFDDLPINGTLPEGKKQSDFARDTVAVLKKQRSAASRSASDRGTIDRLRSLASHCAPVRAISTPQLASDRA
jgi:hypothetical protein